MNPMNEIKAQLETWKLAQIAYVAAREAYRAAWASAFISSKEKNADGRKADADVLTSDARSARDKLEIAAAAEWQLLLAMRGKVDYSLQPGQHFGDAA